MDKEKNKGGRPPIVFTKEQVAQVGALGAFLSIEQIADFMKISRTTFYEIMERQPEVSEQYKEGKARAIGNVAKGLIQQAADGNVSAAIFYLKTQAGWKETQVVDNVSSDGSMTPKRTDLTADELKEALAAAKDIM